MKYDKILYVAIVIEIMIFSFLPNSLGNEYYNQIDNMLVIDDKNDIEENVILQMENSKKEEELNTIFNANSNEVNTKNVIENKTVECTNEQFDEEGNILELTVNEEVSGLNDPSEDVDISKENKLENYELIEKKLTLVTGSNVVYVENESQFSNAFYDKNVSEIFVTQNIKLMNGYFSNHNVKISSLGKALQYDLYNSIVIQNGTTITLNQIVIDGKTYGNNIGKHCITIETGGKLMLTGHSIIDGGIANCGIKIESGGNLQIESCQICNCNKRNRNVWKFYM